MLYRIVVLGDGGCGKTALTLRFCLSHFVETYDPTIEDSYKKHLTLDGHVATIEVLDTAGQEEYKSLHNQWIMEGDGFLIVCALDLASSLESVHKIYHQILMVKDVDRAPIIVAANKCDLPAHARQISPSDLSALSKTLGLEVLETSAKTPVNVEKAFVSLVKLIREERELFCETAVKSSSSRACCILM